jgi:proline iminopeptidase
VAFNELWGNASQERKDILDRKWSAVQAKLETLSAADAMVAAYVARSPMYWYDAEYDCSWIWEDVPINMDMSDHIFGTAFANYDMFPDGKKVEVPVMVALGKHDYVVPYTLWEDQYAQVPDFTKVIFEKSGHTPQLEEAALFDEKLLEWINK